MNSPANEAPTTIAGLEIAMRKGGFSEGRSFIGKDGNRWFLPILTEESWDELPSIRETFDFVQDMDSGDFDGIFYFSSSLLGEMLTSNYSLTNLEIFSIAGGLKSALIAAIAAFNDAREIFEANRKAEAEGISRRDALAIGRFFPEQKDWPLFGWGNHDTCLFDN